MKPVKIAMIGVGDISGIYLKNITETFENIQLVGVCDRVREKAERALEQYPGLRLYETMYDAFEDGEVDIILNLTRPYEHYGVTKAALEAGKHVYTEKPLAATLAEGRELAALAEEKGLLLGGAPDTFLGAGIQTCRKLIDDGFIGQPVGAAGFMICRGHESWHPDPAFYYQRGGGPMLDMGPYYVTAMVHLLGGVSIVSGMSRVSFPKRMITSQPLRSTEITVEVPTYTAGLLQFDSGAIATLFTTFDVHYDQSARLEIYGSSGTLIVPDPNGFGGPVYLLRPEDGVRREIPLLYPYAENSRGLGLSDMADALRSGSSVFRADCRQTLHVLEIMEGIQAAGMERRFIPLCSRYERSVPMPGVE